MLRARGEPVDARAALDILCRTYQPAVLAYIRSRGYNAETAEDLAQNFFTCFLEDAWHAKADPARGRFRSLLLTALKRFLIDAHAESRTLKRGGGYHFESLDTAIDAHAASHADGESPERVFERAWAIAVLDGALSRLRSEAESAGKLALFERLREFLIERPDEADYTSAAAELNLRRNTLAVAVHRLRHRLRELVREELTETTTGRDELECELRELRAALGAVVP